MKMDKKIIIALLAVSLYTVFYELLIIMNFIKMTDYHSRTSSIIFSLFVSIMFVSLVKHKYLIFAGVFGLLHSVCRILAAFLFRLHHPDSSIPVISVMIAGVFFELMTSYYFYKLIKIEDFDLMKNIRLDDIDEYLKKKFHSIK